MWWYVLKSHAHTSSNEWNHCDKTLKWYAMIIIWKAFFVRLLLLISMSHNKFVHLFKATQQLALLLSCSYSSTHPIIYRLSVFQFVSTTFSHYCSWAIVIESSRVSCFFICTNDCPNYKWKREKKETKIKPTKRNIQFHFSDTIKVQRFDWFQLRFHHVNFTRHKHK